MRFSTLVPMLLAAGAAQAQFNNNQNNNNNNNQNNNNNNNQDNNNNNNGGNGGNVLLLDAALVQTNSQATGLEDGAEEGQAASATDDANFINLCTGKTLTNGLQNRQGSCNPIPMGDIPAASNMVSAIFVDPQNGEDKQENTALTFSVQIANLQAGSFTNPDVTYYSAPQALQGGNIVGHTHITVQEIDANSQQPPNAEVFAFFKGVNDNGNGQGLLSATLEAGLPAGSYRVCSMTSASNHQPVLMPVAQRGAQDDCRYFTVGAGNGGNNNNNNNNNNNANGGGAGNGDNANAGAGGNNANAGAGGDNANAGAGGNNANAGAGGDNANAGAGGNNANAGAGGDNANAGAGGNNANAGAGGNNANAGAGGENANAGAGGAQGGNAGAGAGNGNNGGFGNGTRQGGRRQRFGRPKFQARDFVA